MRVGFALVGLLIGAIAGLLVAFLSVFLWYDILQIGDHGADGLSGAATFMVLAPLLALAGGVIGAFRLGKPPGTRSRSVPIVILAVLLSVAALFMLGPMFVF